MMRSVNEVQMLVLKAARGARVPFANAEDLAGAVVAAMHTHPEVLRELLAVLRAPLTPLTLSDGPTLTGSFAFTGPAAIDLLLAGENSVTIKPAPPPNLLAALAKSASRIHGVSLAIRKAQYATVLEFSMNDSQPAKRQTGPVEIDAEVWERLETLAARTYVPATYASRTQGAGANLDDND